MVVLESYRFLDVSLHVCISINGTCLMQEANESVLKFCIGCCLTKTMQKRNSTKPSVVSFYVVGIKEVLRYLFTENPKNMSFMLNTWHKFLLADVSHRFHWTLMLCPMRRGSVKTIRAENVRLIGKSPRPKRKEKG